MIKVLTAAQMQACDRAAIEEYRIPGTVLMENAGLQTAEAIVERFDGPPLSTLVLCGKGNNGGDGFVIARHLHNLGGEVAVHLLGDPDALTSTTTSRPRWASRSRRSTRRPPGTRSPAA
jgi:hydroxyethylthiazole kinase-like uncharacterized protein yjeF